MSDVKKKKTKMVIIILALMVISLLLYQEYFLKPKNSLELYQSIAFSDDFEEAQEFMLEGYESNMKEEDYDFISKLSNSPNQIAQFTLLNFGNKTYVLMTTPGTDKLEILTVEELPEDVRNYFLKLTH